jgi:XTP/dITP diphosphohydrolase
MKKLIIASKNKNKVKEIKEILSDMNFDVVSMEDLNINIDIDETGNTFEENALLKAKGIFELCKEPVCADDSGLEVDYLDGAPGVYSARFAGENATDEDRNIKLLNKLEGVEFENRKARFVCSIAVILDENNYFTVKGTCEGYINNKPVGKNGFGYDPLFFIPKYNMTTAQMSPEKKHEISHRGNALKLMVKELKNKI